MWLVCILIIKKKEAWLEMVILVSELKDMQY